MLIDKLRFKDFLVFGGDQEMRFSFKDDRNVTVILAPNNAGKTTVIRAIKFLLFGASDQKLELLPSLSTISQSSPGAVRESFVEATVREGARRMTLQRSIKWERIDRTLAVRVVGQGGHVVFHEKEGDRRTLLGSAQETFATLVPRSMFDFYFFKGEELTSHLLTPSQGNGIPSEIKKLLYYQEFEDLEKTFMGARGRLTRKLDLTQKKHADYTQAQASQDALQRALNDVRSDLQGLRQRESLVRESVSEIDRKVRELGAAANPERKKNLEDLARRIHLLKTERDNLQGRLHRALGKDFIWILLHQHLGPAKATLEQLHASRALPPDISEALLGKILEEGVCICGGACGEGSPARQRLAEIRKMSLAASLSTELWTLHTKLKPENQHGFGAAALAQKHALVDLEKRREGCARELRTLEGEYARLEPLVDLGSEAEFQRATREREVLTRQVEKAHHDVQAKEAEERNLSQNLRLAQAETRTKLVEGVPQHLSRSIAFCNSLSQAARRGLDEIQRKITGTLPKHLGDLYAAVVTDNSTATIDAATLLPRIERAGILGLGAGGGQQQTLVLCYLISLARLRKEINEEIDAFLGVQPVAAPALRQQAFFMDSVFGQMQDEYRDKVAKVLARELRQVVLLLAGQQWSDGVQAGLKGHITDAYGFEHWTSKKVDADEFVYEFGGRRIRMYREAEAGTQANTKITRLS